MDLYGRQMGVVAGFTLKINGDVESVGLDQGSGSLTEVKGSRLLCHEQTLIVVPMWKAEVTRVTGESEVLRKRVSALLELERDSKEKGTATAELEQMRSQYEARAAKLEESSLKSLEEMRSRVKEIEEQDQTISKFLLNVSVQFRSGEISDSSFAVINDRFSAMRSRNTKEREELQTALAMLSKKESAQVVEMPVPTSS